MEILKEGVKKDYSKAISLYEKALELGCDIIVMLHPDYQYTPKLVPAMASMMAYGQYDAVIASRMLSNSALRGGMPLYKYISNKFLTAFQNILMGEKLFYLLIIPLFLIRMFGKMNALQKSFSLL